jgi:hypothetical protein
MPKVSADPHINVFGLIYCLGDVNLFVGCGITLMDLL